MANSGLLGSIKDFDEDSDAYVYVAELVAACGKNDVIILGQDFANLERILH